MSNRLLEKVILDRDGTVICDKHYLSDPEQVELLPGAVEGLSAFEKAGLGLVIITNQSGVDRGFFSMNQVNAVNAELGSQLRRHGIELDGVFVCPHSPASGCECRKPKPGLLYDAAAKLNFEPDRCVVIGDKISDLDLGRAVGALTVLVRTGKGGIEEDRLTGQADIVADNLEQVAGTILDNLARG